MAIDYNKLREIALAIPEIKKLLIERREIEQKSKEKVTYTHLEPHLTPSNDKFFPKRHVIDKSKVAEIQKQAKLELKNNARKIETALYKDLKKDHRNRHKKHYKEMKATELVTFIEKGRDQVEKDRKIQKEIKKEPKSFERSQKDFNKKLELEKSQKPLNHSQEKLIQKQEDLKNEKLKESNNRLDEAYKRMKEFEENKRKIEQERDRGFSR